MKNRTFYKSKSRQNIINNKNENLCLKYSNINLFKKRELELQNKKSRKNINSKTFYKNGIKPKINHPLSPKITKTDSFPYLLNSISTFQSSQANNTHTKKSYLKKSFSTNYIPKIINNLHLNEEELLNNNIIFNSEEDSLNKKNRNNKNFIKFFETDLYPKTPKYNERKKKDKDNIEFLLNIQEEVNKIKNKKKIFNIDLKIKDLNKKDFGTKKMIKKTRSYIFMKYMTFLKKERFDSFDEEKRTKIDSIQEKINTLYDSQKLFNIKFIYKLSNYLRYLDNLRDKEKIKNIMLLKEKIEYKHKIEQINSEIEKVQIKKNQILKWIYLQIQVKEKKLVLPNFYKKIIESNKAQILTMQQKFYDDKNTFIRDSKKNLNKSGSSKKKKVIMKKSLPNNDKNVLKKSTSKMQYDKTNNKLLNNTKETNINNSNKKIVIEINNIKEYTTKDEFDKVLFWKFSPIFKTFDDFIDSLKELDNQNIYLLKYYNQIQSKIYDSLKELRKIISFKDKSDIIDNQINEKSSELYKIKNKYKLIYKIYSKIKEENTNKQINKYDSIDLNIYNIENKITFKNIDKIYDKINQIFEHCKIVKKDNLLEILDYNIKKSNTKEEQSIYILEFIECTIDYLTERISYYKRNENKNQLIQKIIIEIDKKHKQEKPDKQKLEQITKSLKLIKKLESKNNKIFNINRKIDYYYYNMNNKKKSNISEENKNKDDFPTLEDFMKNTNIINNIHDDNIKPNRRIDNRKITKRK